MPAQSQSKHDAGAETFAAVRAEAKGEITSCSDPFNFTAWSNEKKPTKKPYKQMNADEIIL